jgi:hypothetical protein
MRKNSLSAKPKMLQALGRRPVAGEGQPARLIDPDAKNDGAIAVDRGQRLQKRTGRHLGFRQASEDDRRDRRLQRYRQALDMTFDTGDELDGFVLEPSLRFGRNLEYVRMAMDHRKIETETLPP